MSEMVRYLVILLYFFISACATGYVKLKPANHSLNGIVQAVDAVIPGGSRTRSPNGREIKSYYFDRFDPDKKIDPDTVHERTFVKVRILGDQKPYDVEVGAFVERLDQGRYILVGHDQHIGEAYAKWLNERLAKSTGNLNAIDVFRPF